MSDQQAIGHRISRGMLSGSGSIICSRIVGLLRDSVLSELGSFIPS